MAYACTRGPSRFGLQRSEPEAHMRIARDQEMHHTAAEVADSIEEDDGGRLSDGWLPGD